jgi:hypothetical protein
MSVTKVQLVGNVSAGASFTGIVTFSNISIGSGTSAVTINGTTGIISATSLTLGTQTVSSPGVGINTAGGSVGTGATILDFRGAGISTVTVASGIATINITGGGGGSQLSISTTAPVSPTDGQQWFDTSDGNTYIWYASQNVWVVSQTYGY